MKKIILGANYNLISMYKQLTNSVQEQFGLGREVVVDDVVQQGDVYTTSSNISHN